MTKLRNWKLAKFRYKEEKRVEDLARLFTTICLGGSTCKFASTYNRNTYEGNVWSLKLKKKRERKRERRKEKKKKSVEGLFHSERKRNESSKATFVRFPWNRLKCFSTFVRAYRDQRQKNELVCSLGRNQKEKRRFIGFHRDE